jgi:hypothetical protein
MDLPGEILNIIIGYVGLDMVTMLPLVCKAFHRAAHNHCAGRPNVDRYQPLGLIVQNNCICTAKAYWDIGRISGPKQTETMDYYVASFARREMALWWNEVSPMGASYIQWIGYRVPGIFNGRKK